MEQNCIEYKSNGHRNKNLSLDEYLDKIRHYLRGIITDLQESDTWKSRLTIAVNFVSSRDAEEERVMHLKSSNIKFTSCNDANEVVDEFFKSPYSRYQGNLETSMKGSDFIFHKIKLLYYKCHRINFRHGGSFIDSPRSKRQQKIRKLKIINVFNTR